MISKNIALIVENGLEIQIEEVMISSLEKGYVSIRDVGCCNKARSLIIPKRKEKKQHGIIQHELEFFWQNISLK